MGVLRCQSLEKVAISCESQWLPLSFNRTFGIADLPLVLLLLEVVKQKGVASSF